MTKFVREAGRSAARLILRRTGWLLAFTVATAPLWFRQPIPYFPVS